MQGFRVVLRGAGGLTGKANSKAKEEADFSLFGFARGAE
jgi:hypothetical protein